MKKIFDYTLAILAFVFTMSISQTLAAKDDNESQELKVMSYNIRMGSANDGTNSWQFRFPATLEMIKDQKPDVFGVQEALENQLITITENIKEYKQVGVGRDNGKKKGEFMSIFWNTKTVSLVKWGTFWLSETPDKPSKGWDAACFRTATWALMKDKKTGRKFYFVNTHLDHKGKEAQKNGLMLIIDRIASINPDGYPMVLTGDFNIKPNDPAIAELDKKMSSARKIAEKTDNNRTFNSWGKAADDMIIDYIYVSGFSSCPEYQTVTRSYFKKKYISDHYPIFARLIF
jgi:endonuclease/exonuclease/phosphatase family metal-dependent hydrolase